MVKRINNKTALLLLIIYAVLPVKDAPADPGSKNNQITMDLRNAGLKDALKIISQVSGMNIILDEGVNITADITLKDVPWQTALDNILQTNQLTYKAENNIIRVMTLETAKKEEETVPLTTKIITPNFAKCVDLQASLNKILSSRGNIQTNTSTNSLIITDTPEILSRVENLVNKLDIRTPQVMVEALIASIKLEDKNQFGLKYTISNKLNAEKGLNRTISQTLDLASSNLAATYGKTILPSYDFTALLDLMAQDSRVKILASPRVLTMDNQAAQIEILEQVPYTSVSQSSDGSTTLASTQYKDTGIKLNVTPHITKDKFISLSVKADQSFVASFSTDGQPAVDSRNVETNFMLKSNETVVIGGLNKKDNTTTIDKVPILGDIPFIGRIFRREQKDVVNEELVIFITPRIVENDTLSAEEKGKLTGIKNELYMPGIKNNLSLRQTAIQEALKIHSKEER